MKSVFAVLLLAVSLPYVAFATTAHDLRGRIVIDGNTVDFAGDEWVLDAFTRFPEPRRDSRWGDDNDIRRVAVTWDDYNLYVAVTATTVSTSLMLFIDTTCDGFEDLNVSGSLRRNLIFSGFTPNFLLVASGASPAPEAGFIDCTTSFSTLDPAIYGAVYVQNGISGGALEVALPWNLLGAFERNVSGTDVPEVGQEVIVVAVVTGGTGTGAGDAAPNPSVVLENDSSRVAILNNFIRVPLDADADGVLDVGVEPRGSVSYAQVGESGLRGVLSLRVILGQKLFAPDAGEVLEFRTSVGDPAYTLPVFLSARIYSAAGRLVRNLFFDEARNLSAANSWDEWDGRDNEGSVVPGGIYVLAVSGGPGQRASTSTVKASFAVVR